jgi:hypothetical protein
MFLTLMTAIAIVSQVMEMQELFYVKCAILFVILAEEVVSRINVHPARN